MHSLAKPALLSSNDQSNQILACVVAILLALAVLLVGNIAPDPRLNIAGIPLSSILFMLAIVMACLFPCLQMTHRTAFLCLTPVIFLAFTLPFSLDIENGAFKLSNLVATTFVAATLLAGASQRLGPESVAKLIIAALALLLIAALFYKAHYGFFDRQVLFLLNGPIVFGRLMGLACVLSIMTFQGRQRVLICSLFYVAVLWTASKGPILALTITITAYTLLFASTKQRALFLALLATVATAVYFYLDFLSSWAPLSRLFINYTNTGAFGTANWDSVGSRLVLLRETLQLIANHPYGIGLGSWSAYTGITWAQYPHNFFLELWSEGGILLGSIATVPFLAFLGRPKNPWWSACIFLLLAQQVSGDLLDSRYLLTFSLLGFITSPEVAGPSSTKQLTVQ